MAAAVLAVGLTACGGSPNSEPTADAHTTSSPASGTVTEPEAAYRVWLDALAAEDSEATCSVHAPAFTIELRRRAILEDRAALGDYDALITADRELLDCPERRNRTNS